MFFEQFRIRTIERREKKKWGFPHFLFGLLCEDEMLEEQGPDQIHPAENTDGEDGKDEHDQIDKTLGVKELVTADKNFHEPVNDRDEKKDDLNESGAAVEPRFHF